jgi:hypothetical protein
VRGWISKLGRQNNPRSRRIHKRFYFKVKDKKFYVRLEVNPESEEQNEK